MTFVKNIAAAAALTAFAAVAAGKQAEISALVDELDAAPQKAAVSAPAVAEKPVVQAAAPAPADEKPVAQAPAPAPADEKPVMQAAAPAPTEEKPVIQAAPAEEQPAEKEKKAAKKAKPKKELTGRDAKITSETMAYDRKEGVLFFDRKVYVDDEQYQMHADRVYVFLSGTNDVKRLVALGNVALTNEFRSATCDKAVYVKAQSKVVLYAPENGVATLKDSSEKGGTITGSKITFWLDSEQVEVNQSDITVPGGAFKANDAKKLLGK